MAWSRAFQKCIIYHFLDNFVLQTFLLYNWILQKKIFNFGKFANFFADSKSRAQELSNDVSIVIFRHQTWDLEGGGGANRGRFVDNFFCDIGLFNLRTGF